MNPEIKEKWCAALEGGEYEQARKVLQTNDGKFCCLGVLCDLHLKQTGRGEWVKVECLLNGMVYDAGGEDDKELLTLPQAVQKWAEFDDPTTLGYNPRVIIDGKERPLAEHNDDGVSFAKIAAAIREQL